MNEKGTKIKIVITLVLFVFFSAGIISKLYFLQIKNHQELDKKALRQLKGRFYDYTNRGTIYDRNMRELAVNVQVKSVYAHPKQIKNKRQTVKTISSVLHLPQRQVRNKLKRSKPFAYIKRKITPGELKKLKNKNLEGIHFSTEYKRFYPRKELTSRTIGFAGIDNQGLSGIEYSFDKYLSEGGSWVRYYKDRRGRSIEVIDDDSVFMQEGGSDIVLTIDEVIQYYAAKAIRKKVIEKNAKRGLALVMRPGTGEILALAEYPSYNANLYKNHAASRSNNWGISDSYEPGSTFKVILAAAALEENIARPDDMFFCENGAFDVGGIVIHEALRKKYRWLTFKEIITKSSNIGAVKIGRRLGKDVYYKYIKDFGFGEKTGIKLPGEAQGLVRNPSKWSAVSLGSISIGQEISVTPLQLATAVSAVANGGNLMKPMIAKTIIHNGKVIKNFYSEIERKVLSKKTTETMKEILKNTVVNGTGKKAIIPGYTVAGKTGTAQKIDPVTKKYSKNKFVASFVGFTPVEDPKLTMLILIDEPEGVAWGGSVAAPVFKEIGEKALRYLRTPSKMNSVYSVPVAKYNHAPELAHADYNMNPVINKNILNINGGINLFLDKVIRVLKKYYWEADENILGRRI